jgi:hypothetical protein
MTETKKETTCTLCEISGFHHAVVKTFTLLGGCVAHVPIFKGQDVQKDTLTLEDIDLRIVGKCRVMYHFRNLAQIRGQYKKDCQKLECDNVN